MPAKPSPTHADLLATLQQRFERSMSRHPKRAWTTALALYGARAQDTVPRLRLDFPHRITQRFAEIERELDLSRLDKGDYRLELTVRGEEGSVLARGATRIAVE